MIDYEEENTKRYIIGIDPSIGGDKSALVLVREVEIITKMAFGEGTRRATRYEVIGTKNLTGTLMQMADQIEAITIKFKPADIVIDTSGLGIGLAHILESSGIRPSQLVITGGQNPHKNGRKMTVPRTVLIENLQRLIQQGRIKILKSDHSDLLLKELESFRSVYDGNGKLRFEVDLSRSLSHADFSFALAVAMWESQFRRGLWTPTPEQMKCFSTVSDKDENQARNDELRKLFNLK